MPSSFMIYKAGKLSFLLVCLFLCTACGSSSKAVFEAEGSNVVPVFEEKTEKVYEKEMREETSPKTEPSSLMININTANAETLMQLPGIGEVRAKAVVEHREQYGDFEKIEDIMNVKGIKNGIFSKISNLICVK